jgi:hypothetical protein
MRDIKSERAEFFWRLHQLPRWEQVTFALVNMPFSLITTILCFVLWIPFQLMILTVLPFMAFALVGSVVWICCLGVMLGLSFITERLPVLRPFTFVLALPFLIVAHNVNGLTPAPSVGDMQAKVEKWDLIEAFPLTWSLLRFSI